MTSRVPRQANSGILSEPLDVDAPPKRGRTYRQVPATIGMDVTHQASGMIGAIVECTPAAVTLRDDSGRDRRFRNDPGAFLINNEPILLVTATAGGAALAPRITASGSIAIDGLGARVARASRILVEGIHDAELVERVWGDDLRHEGVVVEPLSGIDDLEEIVRTFGPRPGRRLGVLVDHLVDRSKESRIVSKIDHPDVCITGHVFIDIWAAVNPRRVGLEAWPDIPRGQPWKEGICAAVGVEEPRDFWRMLLAQVRDYRDLDITLVGAVEELIDFVTQPAS